MPFVRALAVLVLVASLSLADELRTLGGKVLQGQTLEVTPSAIKLQTDAGPVSTPLSQVLALELQPIKGIPAGTRYADVRLVDHTLLHCSEVAFKEDRVELTLVSGARLNLPLSAVAWVVQEAQDSELKKKFDVLAAKQVRRDRVVILRDGELNPIDGTIGRADAKGQSIEFKIEGGKAIDLPLAKLHGLVFYRTEAPQENPVCLVYDSHGNSLMAVKLASEGNTYKIATSFGTDITLARDVVAKLDFNMGKLTFLSDIEPVKVVERSGIGLVTRYRKDTNLDGEPIVFRVKEGDKEIVKEFKKGLSLHAHTELEYDLGGKYKEFKAVLGVDPTIGAESQPLVSIYCDGEKRFSETITPAQTRPVALNVKDVRKLKIVVSSRNFLDLHDHATLADARVSQ